MEILLHYRWLFIQGNVFIGEWSIFGAKVFLCYSQIFVKGNFIIGRVQCNLDCFSNSELRFRVRWRRAVSVWTWVWDTHLNWNWKHYLSEICYFVTATWSLTPFSKCYLTIFSSRNNCTNICQFSHQNKLVAF